MIETQASIFQALASPIRLAIVTLLYRRDMAVSEITDALGEMGIPKTADRTNVCKNLALLRDLYIVTVSKRRQQRIYSLQARCLVDAVRCTLDVIAMRRRTNTVACGCEKKLTGPNSKPASGKTG